MGAVSTPTFMAGLAGVVAAETRLSSVDGEAGELVIAGFPVEELASRASFEEIIYLLWHDALPSAAQLVAFQEKLAARRDLPRVTLNMLQTAAAQKTAVTDALRMAMDTLSLQAAGEPRQDAMMLVAAFPTIIAAYWRLLNRLEPLPPRPDLGHAANYLYMLFGRTPSSEHIHGLETYLNTVVDHGMNASTFTARVIISTQSDMTSAVVGALGALKGPLHGGAPGPALDMILEIGDVSQAEPYLRQKLERGERLMGFGHRVYKVRDPRAEVLSAAAARIYQHNNQQSLYQLACQVEQIAVALLAEYKPGRHLQTNVEFYTALLLHGLGLTSELFTPTFAMSRVAGWTAHCFEQQRLNRLIRPQSVYIGSQGRRWIPVERRLN
jgi:citrate synthase